uniref:Intraflagellar transport protein 20 n=1 Tax=Pyramimonas obovata TaxID=1411642 RepID=A0A6T7WUZ9_9CHLO|mmetsp:Transcript_29681/g.64804  ORF Transcript_29681/g.64804 Transcript_29681/m.64804 type:complete len:132 (+) Transcript_29681:281-676(+)|eukprot:CAMPEP_0118921086 /NCGR_PEP_ID=MMETSP1169-20130426/471_1 /TAXON_ID=36882 /ORGANISM="Pyramimonas obovata, Strain CCMP722" /LENGTH=131 /DNA_ID=CAMNT_0006861747 /DNA_START=277 /DNA_END=672 /DNA_ORIENTATION=+
MNAAENRGITFDELYRVRVLDPDRYAQTEQLKDECSSFTDKIQTLNSVVKTLVDAVDAQAEKIDDEKLRAVGMRNKAAAEVEVRRRKKKEMKQMMIEKQEELERLNGEYESLVKVKQEQELMIAKLSSSGV